MIPSGPDSPDASGEGAPHPALSPRTLHICHRLLASLITDFTPVLFTACAASHMTCTDIIADCWMTDVITPALADGGVPRPLKRSLPSRQQITLRLEIHWNTKSLCF
jgi:hypothetical protein